MPDPALNDNDNTTCYTPQNSSVLVEWVDGIHVASWVRLVFEPGAEVYHFRLTYDTGSKVYHCDDPQNLIVPGLPDAFDLNCFVVQPTKLLAITWQGNGSFCTINVCAGRNLAMFAVPSINVRPFPNLADGDKSSRNCTTLSEVNKHELTFSFKREVLLSSIDVYLVSNMNVTRMELTTYLGTNRSRQIVTFNFPEALQRFVLNNSLLTRLQMKIVKGSASVCEVELNGDCSRGSYGDGCEDICSFFCYQERCTYDSRCVACALGFSGPYCHIRDDRNPTTELNRADVVTIPIQGVQYTYWTFAEFLTYLTGIFVASSCVAVLIYYLIPPENIPGTGKKADEKSTSLGWSDIESDEQSNFSDDEQTTASPEVSSLGSDSSIRNSETSNIGPESNTAARLSNSVSDESDMYQFNVFQFKYQRRESEIN